MKIELLSFDGCPNHERLLERLPRLLAGAGVTVPVTVRTIADAEAAEHARFLGSPSLRIDGRDVEPDSARRTDYGLKCRIYHTAAGISGLPPDEWILAALDRGRAG